MNAHGLIYKK